MPENSLKTLRLINFLLCGLIVLSILFLARGFVSSSFTKKDMFKEPSVDKAAIHLKKKDIMQYSSILENNPFGKPMDLNPISVKKKKPVPSGSLSDLTLVGTVTGPLAMSYAIIENKSKSDIQEIFAYQDNVYNYGVLTKITMTSIEIEKNSKTYTLSIPLERDKPSSKKLQSKKGYKAKKAFARKVGKQKYVLDSRRVQQSLESPEKILTDARLLPNFVDGRQEGFVISEVVNDGIYDSLGMKNGDVLLRINGLEMSNPEVAIQAMTALKGMNKVNLDIIRKGKNMSMNYQIK